MVAADGTAFSTNANELLTDRSEQSTALLGSNQSSPDLTGGTGTTIAGIRRENALALLRSAGAGVDRIAQLAGVPGSTVRELIYGSGAGTSNELGLEGS